MKTLYISDLDGTLLRSDAKISEYTAAVINDLTSRGILFSYATARSYITASKVTEGLKARIPIITYNGAVILQNDTCEILAKNTFAKEEKEELLNMLLDNNIYPIVYAYVEGKEKFSFDWSKCNNATKEFLLTRKGDVRENLVESIQDLNEGDVFYYTCIDSYEKLEPLYIQFKDKYHCIFQKDIYSGEQWLEIIPKNVSKANAIKQLKEYLGVDYVIAFGDGKNDIEMFELADESYAVENAVDELKTIATGIIESNDSDGVARWLERELRGKQRMRFIYTDGCNKEFIKLCYGLDDFLNNLVGGEENRSAYIPYNNLDDIHDVILAYDGEIVVGSACYKKYDDESAEVKRVFIKEDYRGRGISKDLMKLLEDAARKKGYKYLILESGEPLVAAMALYRQIGFDVIPNYGPYKDMTDSVCMRKKI